jgi:hypothetical protein
MTSFPCSLSTFQVIFRGDANIMKEALCSLIPFHIQAVLLHICISMDESFPFSVLGTGNGELYCLNQLLSGNSECNEQTCLERKSSFPESGMWRVSDGIEWIFWLHFISALYFKTCHSLCTGTCFWRSRAFVA